MGAQRRFQRLPSMLPAKVDFPSPPEDVESLDSLDATVVDISPGGVCMRIAMDDDAYRVMEHVSEGLYVEVAVAPSDLRRYTVLGRVAWIWVPSMEADDEVGSIGVDIKGVAEEDLSWLGKMRRLFAREEEVEVDKSSRLIRVRTARLAAAEAKADGDAAEPEAKAGDEAAEPEAEADDRAAEPEAKADDETAEGEGKPGEKADEASSGDDEKKD